MAVDYINRAEEMTIECDQCGIFDDFEGDFAECIKEAQDNGWVVFKDSGDFIHLCSEECRLDYNEEK